MAGIKPESLVWDDWNIKHIARHNVVPEEVEEMLRDPNRKRVRSYKDRQFITGRAGRRMISAVFASEGKGKFYPISARDASKKERRNYREI